MYHIPTYLPWPHDSFEFPGITDILSVRSYYSLLHFTPHSGEQQLSNMSDSSTCQTTQRERERERAGVPQVKYN